MSTMIAVPDELVEQVKAVAHSEALEQFFIDAARKQVRQIRSRLLREEHARAEQNRSPGQIYTKMLADVVAFETQYGLSSDQFLTDFESGVVNEDPNDWVAFYRWRTLAHGLQRMEKEYGFRREANSDGDRQF